MQATSELARRQQQLTRHLRNPDHEPPPAGVEERRLKVYRELLFNNVEGFLSGGFPVFRSLLDDARWYRLVRAFFVSHRAHAPYFLQVGEEFRAFLATLDLPAEGLPAFTHELMHYEWIELALDVSDAELPECTDQLVREDTRLALSPLAAVLAYAYPVQRIGPGFQPTSPDATPTFLAVHRDQQHRVRFTALNGLTYALLARVEEQPGLNLQQLARSLHQLIQGQGPEPSATFLQQLTAMVQQLVDQQILCLHPLA